MKATRHSNDQSREAYFDCNATTPVLPQAAEAAFEVMAIFYGNPSSSHQTGLRARDLLETTRKKTALVIGAHPEQVIFTSGATESIQTAVFSALHYWKTCPHPSSLTKILYSATEHKAVPEAIRHWVKTLELPYEMVEIPVDSNGQLDWETLKLELPQTILLCTMAVNNETGVIHDLERISDVLKSQNSPALWLVDCVQALGKIDLKLNSSRIDYAVFSGHKFYAPKGIGFLYYRSEDLFYPLMVGGGQEKGHRSGTQNLPGLAGLGAVLDLLLHDKSQAKARIDGSLLIQPHEQLLKYREKLLAVLQECFPKLILNTPLSFSVPTTLNFSVPGFRSSELLDVFDSAGLRVSAGSACNASKPDPSHVLKAMGFPDWRSTSAVRLSFGPLTSQKEVDLACNLIQKASAALSASCLLESQDLSEPPSVELNGVIQLRLNSNNTWMLIHQSSKTCIVIDPAEPLVERISQIIRCQKLNVLAILDTHIHSENSSARIRLQSVLADRVIFDPRQVDSLGWPSVHPNLKKISLKSSQGLTVLVLEVTEKSSLIFSRITDSDKSQDDTQFLLGVLSTAGDLSVQFAFCGGLILDRDRSGSTFLAHDSELAQWIQENTLICPIRDSVNQFATTLHGGQDSPSFRADLWADPCVKQDELEVFLDQKSPQPLLIVDVREPQEFSLCQVWSQVGFTQPIRNVPISRLVQFMSELLLKATDTPRVLFLCRSGNRSLQATQALRKLGFRSAWSLEDGIALLG